MLVAGEMILSLFWYYYLSSVYRVLGRYFWWVTTFLRDSFLFDDFLRAFVPKLAVDSSSP